MKKLRTIDQQHVFHHLIVGIILFKSSLLINLNIFILNINNIVIYYN